MNALQEHLIQIIDNVNSDAGYLKLRQFGQKHGFINNYYRKKAWILLLEIKENDPKNKCFKWVDPSTKCVQFDQIVKDVNRSLNTLDVSYLMKYRIEQLRLQLLDVLDGIFVERPKYLYYQGYHDIVSVFMFVLGTDLGYQASISAADIFFRDFLVEPFEISVLPLLSMIKRILVEYSSMISDKAFLQVLEQVPFLSFPVPWLLTWFSHSITKFTDILRIWDYLLCSPPHNILYLCCGFIIHHKAKFQDEHDDMGETMASLQFYFQSISDRDNNIQQIIELSQGLLLKIPFEEFSKNKDLEISESSILYQKNFNKRLSYLDDLKKDSLYVQCRRYIKSDQVKTLTYPLFGVIVSMAMNFFLIKCK